MAVPDVVDVGGHVNKFFGDGALAVFGAPNDFADHADAAVSATVQIHRLVRSAHAPDVATPPPARQPPSKSSDSTYAAACSVMSEISVRLSPSVVPNVVIHTSTLDVFVRSRTAMRLRPG
jgi:hypothetical protein